MTKTTEKDFPIKHMEGTFTGVCETSIYYQAWIPEQDVKAVLILVHGIGEHCGRYMNVVNYFIPLHYALYGLDHVGHGKSGGDREFIRTFDDYTCTLHEYYNMVRDWHPHTSIFLVGHSMIQWVSLRGQRSNLISLPRRFAPRNDYLSKFLTI